ncbi:hypothetical protein VTL71DRAFT_803 [Oculimacula yallundae]|uniref:Uncharacterized protein n=1 Tax=Oculimacula yallundae TaxID=86028 RepID=A0ABR4D1A7_9HELO
MPSLLSLFPILALSLLATATPTPDSSSLIARGESVATITTFAAASCRDPARRQYLVDRSSPSAGHIVANTCVSETAYGSIAVDFVGARCQFEKHLSGLCDDPPHDVVTSFNGARKCLSGEAAPAAFWIVRCT